MAAVSSRQEAAISDDEEEACAEDLRGGAMVPMMVVGTVPGEAFSSAGSSQTDSPFVMLYQYLRPSGSACSSQFYNRKRTSAIRKTPCTGKMIPIEPWTFT